MSKSKTVQSIPAAVLRAGEVVAMDEFVGTAIQISAQRAYKLHRDVAAEVVNMRGLGLLFRGRLVNESAEDWATLEAKFTPPEALLAEWKTAYCDAYIAAHPREQVWVRVPGSSTVVPWTDDCTSVDTFRTSSRLAYDLKPREFGALPGHAGKPETEKGVVWILRDAVQDSAVTGYRAMVAANKTTDENGGRVGKTRAQNLDPWERLEGTQEQVIKTLKKEYSDAVALYFKAEFDTMLDMVKRYAILDAKAAEKAKPKK
jgi:hypothetical protein